MSNLFPPAWSKIWIFFFGLHSKEVDDLECKNLYTNDFFYFMRVQVTLYWVFSRWENCTDTQQSDYLNYFLHISSTEKNIWYLNPRVGFGLGYPKYFRERVSECTGRYYKWRPYILYFLPLWRPLRLWSTPPFLYILPFPIELSGFWTDFSQIWICYS